MSALRPHAAYLARLFAFCCAMDGWQKHASLPLTNETALRECEKWIAWHCIAMAEVRP